MVLMLCLVTMLCILSFKQDGKSNYTTKENTTEIKQSNDSVFLIKKIDEMSGKTYIFCNRSFIISNDDKSKGFRVDVFIMPDITFKFITVTMVGIGGCNEKDEIIILFENGEKITKKSWNKFNCDGEAYFFLDQKDINLLITHTLSKIRMTNGRSYDSYTGDVKEKDKRYFIQLFYALDNKLVTENK